MPRYLSILANFITIKAMPYDIFPWWLFFLRWRLLPRELVYFAFVALLSIWVGLFEPQRWTAILASNFLEVLIFSGFLLMGHSLFERATHKGFLKLALAIAVLTALDFYVLNLKITAKLTNVKNLLSVASEGERGAFVLATEASYWALTLLGFYVFALAKRWWLAAFSFGLLLFWNKGIYAMSLMLLCTLAILPLRAAVQATIVGALVVLAAFWLDVVPARPLALVQKLLGQGYSADDLLVLVQLIENDHGSRRYSAVINSVLHAQIWYAQPSYEPYSLFSQLLLNYGWIRGVLVWLWLLVLVALRHPLTWREMALVALLTVIAGPLSIPFVYSFVFARSLSAESGLEKPPDTWMTRVPESTPRNMPLT
ncbi:MAG: hypothetical protein QM527_05545 [Alphaproteobacteria bacterium]|nr:hypothetical protein [Alphaproteobacteria bacterium]